MPTKIISPHSLRLVTLSQAPWCFLSTPFRPSGFFASHLTSLPATPHSLYDLSTHSHFPRPLHLLPTFVFDEDNFPPPSHHPPPSALLLTPLRLNFRQTSTPKSISPYAKNERRRSSCWTPATHAREFYSASVSEWQNEDGSSDEGYRLVRDSEGIDGAYFSLYLIRTACFNFFPSRYHQVSVMYPLKMLATS